MAGSPLAGVEGQAGEGPWLPKARGAATIFVATTGAITQNTIMRKDQRLIDKGLGLENVVFPEKQD